MLVVPIVFVSLVCGVCHIGQQHRLGQLAAKTVILYLLTTAIAASIAVIIASFLNVGSGISVTTVDIEYIPPATVSVKENAIGHISKTTRSPRSQKGKPVTGHRVFYLVWFSYFLVRRTWHPYQNYFSKT